MVHTIAGHPRQDFRLHDGLPGTTWPHEIFDCIVPTFQQRSALPGPVLEQGRCGSGRSHQRLERGAGLRTQYTIRRSDHHNASHDKQFNQRRHVGRLFHQTEDGNIRTPQRWQALGKGVLLMGMAEAHHMNAPGLALLAGWL